MPDARDLAADALVAMERDDAFARDVVERLRDGLADPRDRGLLTEIAYGVARREGTLDHLLSAASRTPLVRLDPCVRAALRAGLYQVLFLERVPAHAAVDAAVRYAKERTNPRFAGFVNGVLRGLARAVEGPGLGAEDPSRDVPRPGAPPLRFRRAVFPDPASEPVENLAARFAHPAWLVARWTARLGVEGARPLLEAGCGRPPLVLRAPPGGRAGLLDELARGGVPARAGEGPDEVVVAEGEAAALVAVREGRAAVQDGTAQRVAPLLAPSPGQRLLDLCAAPGGKTLHLLDLLGDRGEVVACDASPSKVAGLRALLQARGARGGPAACAVEVPEEGPLPFGPASFDGALVDAPCSNTGVLRRRPEVRRRLRERDVAALALRQRSLLERALPLVRPGGRLVYSTCSVEPEENGDVVAAVAAAHPGLVVEPGFDVLPSPDHDGGFAAVLLT